MANPIQFRRGLKTNLPILSSGEPGWCTDTKEVFIGDGSSNYQILMHHEFDANSFLAANADDTPVAVTVAEQRIVGRKTGGNIGALTNAEIMAILSGGAGASFSMNSQKITSLADGVDPGDGVNKGQLDAVLGSNDAMVYKGAIDCSTNPDYPAADAGHTYKISVAGNIGGASGPEVEIGDMAVCLSDSTASGDHATVGSNWNIIQVNIDGAVIGPASSTDDDIATFDGITGKLIQSSGTKLSDLATNTHTHGNISNDGKIGSTANLVIVTGADGVLTAKTAGTETEFLRGDGSWQEVSSTDTATAADDILDGSNIGTEITYAPYSTNQAGNRKFYVTGDDPTGTDRLNIGAYFHATQLYEGSVRVLNENSTIDGGTFV